MPGVCERNLSPCKLTTSKNIVPPFVAAFDQGAHKTSDNHHLVDEDHHEDRGPRQGSGEQEIGQEERRSYEPIDVTDVEDLTSETPNTAASALELDFDRCPAQVGCHGEVGNRGDHGDSGSHVVEDTMGARLGCSEAYEGERCHRHDGADRPVPVTAMGGDLDVGVRAIDIVICEDGQRRRE